MIRSTKRALVGAAILVPFILPVPQASAESLVTPDACAVSQPTREGGTQAVTPTSCCVVTTNYSLTSTPAQVPFAGVPTLTNGPGPLSATFSRTVNGTASYSVTAGAESEVGAVLAKAKASISASLTLSNGSSLTNSVTLTAGAGQYAHGRYVSWGRSVSYTKYRTNYNCSTTVLARGTIKFPTTSEGWYTWVDTKPYV